MLQLVGTRGHADSQIASADRNEPMIQKGRVLIYNRASLAGAAAKWVVRAIESAIHQHGHCSLALAGGTAWRPVYRRMTAAWLADRVPWDRVSMFFGDERCVPPDDPRSNYRMAERSLLLHSLARKATVHRIRAEDSDPAAAARDYARLLPASFDVLLLGIGADGHTASLFPHAPALAEKKERMVAVSGGSGIGRITITPPVIRSAANVFVLAAGTTKADATARALEGRWQPELLPIQYALGATWLLDNLAARMLHGHYQRGG